MRNFVRNLRRKLGDNAARPAYLFNERGVGYRMAPTAESQNRPVASSGQRPATDKCT